MLQSGSSAHDIKMRKIFSGRKKFFTIPLVFLLGLLFLPLTIMFLIGWFTKSKINNSKIKLVIYSILGIVALPFVAAYAIAFTSPSKESTQPSPTTMATVQPTIRETSTNHPSISPIPTAIASPTPAAKPTTIPSTPKPTVKPVATPVPTTTATSTNPSPNSGSYACDCSKACTEISTCSEAQYQLKTCGCSQRDIDGDGIACDGAPLHCQN